MRKIIVGAQVSMDGVMQAPGRPREDPSKGFTRRSSDSCRVMNAYKIAPRSNKLHEV